MNMLEKVLSECERKNCFDVERNYTKEEILQMTKNFKKRIPGAKCRYYLRKTLENIRKFLGI